MQRCEPVRTLAGGFNSLEAGNRDLSIIDDNRVSRSNLAEVSDWLTKLLLGAGLVQLTRLGAPVAQLIDNIAAGLHSTAASASGAKVAAGAILFGYTITGILVRYVVTTLWYQKRITNQQTPTTLT